MGFSAETFVRCADGAFVRVKYLSPGDRVFTGETGARKFAVVKYVLEYSLPEEARLLGRAGITPNHAVRVSEHADWTTAAEVAPQTRFAPRTLYDIMLEGDQGMVCLYWRDGCSGIKVRYPFEFQALTLGHTFLKSTRTVQNNTWLVEFRLRKFPKEGGFIYLTPWADLA